MSNVRKDILERKQEIEQWIAEERSLAEITRLLNCRIGTLYAWLKKMNIEYHGQQSKIGRNLGNGYTSAWKYLGTDKPIASDNLKKKLFREGIKEKRCECCGNTIWLGKPIKLELHHINGNHYDNSLENLQILCPNCHAMQDNNSGKNVKAHRQKNVALAELVYAAGLDPVSSECEFKSRGRHQSKKLKHSVEESVELRKAGKVDSIGRVSDYILTEQDWQKRKDLILNSNVDLTKFGWKVKVQQKTGLTRRQVDDVIDHFKDYFKDKVYIR